ncbi:MAG: hypothetical protein AAAB20_11960 [Rhizobium sp.]|jgi:hypothetical protein|uniref:DUF6894 family protein n=1 Tax=Rhizobium sp. TaxID=391 RepID=UPI000A986623
MLGVFELRFFFRYVSAGGEAIGDPEGSEKVGVDTATQEAIIDARQVIADAAQTKTGFTPAPCGHR